jgi:hypothetical protein
MMNRFPNFAFQFHIAPIYQGVGRVWVRAVQQRGEPRQYADVLRVLQRRVPGARRGRAVQVDPKKPKLKPAGTKR